MLRRNVREILLRGMSGRFLKAAEENLQRRGMSRGGSEYRALRRCWFESCVVCRRAVREPCGADETKATRAAGVQAWRSASKPASSHSPMPSNQLLGVSFICRVLHVQASLWVTVHLFPQCWAFVSLWVLSHSLQATSRRTPGAFSAPGKKNKDKIK